MFVRLVVALALLLPALSVSSSDAAQAAESWRDRGWYGWLVIDTTTEDSGQSRDTHLRLRVEGFKATVAEAGGTWVSVYTGPPCTRTTDITILGPGQPEPFGSNAFAVLPGPGGANEYTLEAYDLPWLQHTITSWSGSTCGPPIEDTRTGFISEAAGCGAFDWERDPPGLVPCHALDTNHLRGSADYTEQMTEGWTRDVVSWDLAADPAEDPCLELPDHCLDDDLQPGTGVVTTAPTGANGTLGSACGPASFTWRHVTLSKTSVEKGESACVFLVGNDLAKTLLDVAITHDVPIGTAFAAIVLRDLVGEWSGSDKAWVAAELANKAILEALKSAMGTIAKRFGPIAMVGDVAGLLAMPVAGAWVVKQVRDNDACMQVIVDRESTGLKVDWSLVYAHSSDANKKSAKVYRKVKRFGPDVAKPVLLNMRCTTSGGITVSGDGSAAMSPKKTSYLRYE